ncbi:competence type IV pilus minor pilin ComGF [Enterococcus malodoratus]|uniref:competence type IV pilus minor pilin ComGF n=1 Tax=Enterococcus malodoratus TaxID=71451 RepID=UPI003FD66A5E
MPKNKGFTLLESLVALLMLSGILLLLSGLIQHAHKMEQALSGYHQLEWEIFLLQLDNELHEVKYIGTSQTEISTEIESKGKMVPLVIKKVNNRIIKRQSGGNQPLLMGVNQFVCQEKNNGVDFVVTFTDGRKKEGTWIFE